jgi:hypothetical protein
MKRNTVVSDHAESPEIQSDLEQIERLLCSDENVNLSDIDKQILAASYREASRKSSPPEYIFSWWRKLSLPLYIAAGFSFSVVAIQSLWQAPGNYQTDSEMAAQSNNRTSNSSIVIELEQSDHLIEKNERELPVLIVAPGVSPRAEQEIVDVDNGQLLDKGSLLLESDETIYTGNQLQRAEHPELESWARSIIEQFKQGNESEAKAQLELFKKAYPDYPIDEQVKLFNR